MLNMLLHFLAFSLQFTFLSDNGRITSGDDMQALIWDLQHLPRPIEDPILAYSAAGEVSFLYIYCCFEMTHFQMLC